MKKIIMAVIATVSAIIMTGCSVTYYSYYEANTMDVVNIASLEDACWSKSKVTPTRCICAYTDSTGHLTYLMETKCHIRMKDLNKIDNGEIDED